MELGPEATPHFSSLRPWGFAGGCWAGRHFVGAESEDIVSCKRIGWGDQKGLSRWSWCDLQSPEPHHCTLAVAELSCEQQRPSTQGPEKCLRLLCFPPVRAEDGSVPALWGQQAGLCPHHRLPE